MNCIAIDDEPLALNVIEEFCKKIDFLHLDARFTSAIQAIDYLARSKPDLIFLDIQMPHVTGMQFLKTLNQPPMVIFTTAYSNYALEGFNVDAVDYLLKPIAFDRFLKATSKAYNLYSLTRKAQPAEEQEKYLLVKVEYSTVKINADEILYIEGLKDYVKIYTGAKFIMTKSTMKHIEERLPQDKFIRIHKSYIVSVPKIKAIEYNRVLVGDKQIPIGNQFKQGFNEMIRRIRL
jgi:DNA-binding LytR/AlgR family response regulator